MQATEKTLAEATLRNSQRVVIFTGPGITPKSGVPGAAHHAISHMQRNGRQVTVVTQNIDDLHEQAGNQAVIHLHGHIGSACCGQCAVSYDPEPDERASPPNGASCSDQLRPGMYWFNRTPPQLIWQAALAAIEDCDLLLVAGTSGRSGPASYLPLLALQNQACLLLINPEQDSYLTRLADYCFYEAADVVLPRLARMLLDTP